jgi:hypothetical protein
LKTRGIATQGKKSELVERLFEFDQQEITTKCSCNLEIVQNHTVIIMDSELQEIPWECLPSLSNSRCSRVPSLSILLSLIPTSENNINESYLDTKNSLTETKKSKTKISKTNSITNSCLLNKSIDIKKSWYAIDVEGNLPATRETMAPFIDVYRSKWNWRGLIAEMPSAQSLR